VKWVFLLAIVAVAPVLAALLRTQKQYLVPTAAALGFSMFVLAPRLWAAPVPWPGWPGYVHGIEVSFLDSVSVAVILATRRVHISRFIVLSFALLCIAFIVSTIAGQQTMPALFYGWQLVRSALLFVAVARLCASDPRAPVALIAGLGVGLIYEAGLATNQFAHGATRPGGNLTHANFLGLASDFVLFPAVAMMLSSRRFFLWAIVVAAGMVIAITGGSRATLGLSAAGTMLTIFLSIRHRRTSRKMAFGALAGLLVIASIPAMIWAANRRTEAEKISSDQERSAMKLAAKMMAEDHPLGVGANQYVVVANVGGYSQRAGVAWNPENRTAPVHDTYYLVMAEMGYLGLAGFLATIASIILLGLRLLRKHIPGDAGELVPGLVATMIIAAIHVSFEYVFMNFVPHYLFAICGGMLVALAARANVTKMSARPVPSRVPVPSPAE
jgi:hypothetical protein